MSYHIARTLLVSALAHSLASPWLLVSTADAVRFKPNDQTGSFVFKRRRFQAPTKLNRPEQRRLKFSLEASNLVDESLVIGRRTASCRERLCLPESGTDGKKIDVHA